MDDVPTASSVADRAVDAVLRRSPFQVAARQLARRRLTVLAYHGVDDPGAFDLQLAWLASRTNPISLGDLLHAANGGPLPECATLVTFDDGERSVLEHGLPLLRRHGVPAVAFVVAGLLDTSEPFWWDEVAYLVAAGGTAPAIATSDPASAVRALKLVPDGVRRESIAALRASAPGAHPGGAQLTAEEVRRMARDGVAVGNHSLSHPILDRCPDDVLDHEIAASHSILTRILGKEPKAFAYPNGDQDPRVRRTVARHGYEVAFAFDHRVTPWPPADLMAVSRVRVDSTASVDRLATITSGLNPFILRATRRV